MEDAFRDMTKKGQKYPFQFVDVEAELHFGKYARRGLVAGLLLHVRPGRVPRRRTAVRHPTARTDHEGRGDLAEGVTRGPITGDINRRRGIIEETSEDKGVSSVMAKIPLAELFGYTSDLRSATGGTASFSMEFSHYAPVREELADLPKVEKK